MSYSPYISSSRYSSANIRNHVPSFSAQRIRSICWYPHSCVLPRWLSLTSICQLDKSMDPSQSASDQCHTLELKIWEAVHMPHKSDIIFDIWMSSHCAAYQLLHDKSARQVIKLKIDWTGLCQEHGNISLVGAEVMIRCGYHWSYSTLRLLQLWGQISESYTYDWINLIPVIRYWCVACAVRSQSVHKVRIRRSLQQQVNLSKGELKLPYHLPFGFHLTSIRTPWVQYSTVP